MGGAVSAGADNDELIDNLLEADYIKTVDVERVFRAVDRGHYFTSECKDSAYKDLAWKCGNLHISAPCIYSEVMESLKLEPGMSFLNLGSGTGYLSTMAGLILGCNGVNHGIEIHADVLDYAKARLEEFCRLSPAVDEYEFCSPRFVNGNCLSLPSDCRQYDRVYCGAACPENHEAYMKSLMKVGGILVMPINEQLLQIHRTSATHWETKSVLPVSFATLLGSSLPGTVPAEHLKTPEVEPLSLQDLCRYTVRALLRRNIDQEHPELKRRPPRVPRKRVKRTLRQLVIPIFGSDSEDGDGGPGPDHGRGGFMMDVHNGGRASRTIIELSQLLQDPFRLQVMQAVQPPAQDPPRSPRSAHPAHMSDDDYLSDLEEPPAKVLETDSDMADEGESGAESVLEQRNKAKETRREKFDSGIVEDMDNGKAASSGSDGNGEDDCEEDDMDLCSDSEPCDDRRPAKYSVLDLVDSDTDTDGDSHGRPRSGGGEPLRPQPEPELLPPAPQPSYPTYSSYMRDKIQMLPLPATLKLYLNLNRAL